MAEEMVSTVKQDELSLKDTAEYLGVVYQTAWRWAKAGRFKGIRQETNGRIAIPAGSAELVRQELLERRNAGRGVRHDG